MERVKCIIAYDGTNFSGYQVQPNKRTVQSEIEGALKKMHKGYEVKIVASGRTDAKVHALGQVIHFDSTFTISPDRWKQALNALFPDDIQVKSVEIADSGFHARYDVSAKEYRYKLLTSHEGNVFERNYSYHYPYPLDLDAMRKAADYLVGTHDFSSFCASRTGVKDKVRTITHIQIEKQTDELIFSFLGNGFLYNMVRILVGTLLDVGRGAIPPFEVKNILASRDRTLAGKTAPGQGLYLWKVFYGD
ncbi:tRNA pseudouridine(38-40) synthase TruA [Fredinandcohnia quinoae]|uniref:tRNA pseudouridine synthase A n=1 Tax=Fredinandcohnia quinoae TaxID=2918902 RepID=A0AAW5E9H4_9BACI|nr:tRNA pseudouridine(38-40) synthase TruA [Fredinandcohnia sp. SECRCQ15]MCH1626051.1 tRNA pseudouridine(38-40) synthase TruA [Fredinandcohnia sp. SECRCQ15]